ncbi:MAG: hypothetical protein QNJ94_11220 [Alphaproteobacteria bacterium]|nr:hypothetical protein [Alphaproteobacteria bacterium]
MFADPITQSVIVPAVAALVLMAAIRLALGDKGDETPPLATAAIPIAFLTAYVVTLGLPPYPPRASSQKLAYVALIGLTLGIALDLIRPKGPAWLVPLAGVAWPAVIAIWLAWPKLKGFDLFAVFTVAMLWIGGALAFLRLSRLRAKEPYSLAPGILLLIGSVGAAGLGFHFASIAMAQLAGALAAAVSAALLWNWIAVILRPDGPLPFGRGAVFGSTSALFAIVTILGLYTETSLWVLLFLVPIFFAHLVFGERPGGDGLFARAFRPVLLLVVGSVPLLLLGSVVMVLSILTAT